MAEKDGLDIGAEEEKSGGKKKLIIIVVLALLLLGGGGAAAYFFLFSGSDDPAVSAEESEAVVPTEPSVYLALDPAFTVDFMIDGRKRYLQLNMTVKSRNSEQVDALKLHEPLIRNSLVLLFSSQSFDELKTVEGKTALKEAALNAINGILEQETGQGGMDAVLFTNFVMQ
ncbi:MAG: flagellar basal body-associated FliL family protein [Marinomonas hwangdonensis]|nr:flagellar basal body-associated FliL family protein [Marinomonas hwangdonensis]